MNEGDIVNPQVEVVDCFVIKVNDRLVCLTDGPPYFPDMCICLLILTFTGDAPKIV